MIISEIQSEIGHCSCDSAKYKAPADFSHHAILLFDFVLKWISYENNRHQEATIKMYIAYINMLSFSTFFNTVALIVLRQYFLQ